MAVHMDTLLEKQLRQKEREVLSGQTLLALPAGSYTNIASDFTYDDQSTHLVGASCETTPSRSN